MASGGTVPLLARFRRRQNNIEASSTFRQSRKILRAVSWSHRDLSLAGSRIWRLPRRRRQEQNTDTKVSFDSQATGPLPLTDRIRLDAVPPAGPAGPLAAAGPGGPIVRPLPCRPSDPGRQEHLEDLVGPARPPVLEARVRPALPARLGGPAGPCAPGFSLGTGWSRSLLHEESRIANPIAAAIDTTLCIPTSHFRFAWLH